MNEREALTRMIAPGTRRPGKYREGVVQILVTSACDKHCLSCTQLSQLRRKPWFMTPEQFATAVNSLEGYFGVVGVFGGNPAISPHFAQYCEILKESVPYVQRGLWCNNPVGKGRLMRGVFNPAHSNLNVHLDRDAYDEFRRDWPEARPFGLDTDSRHSPPYVAIKDVVADESQRWELISQCDINRHWSACVTVFRDQVKAYFCEIAAAQAVLYQHDSGYPDTGLPAEPGWWRKPMEDFAGQVRKHCHECGVPLRGYGQLSQDDEAAEQVSQTHVGVYRPKRHDRRIELVTTLEQLHVGRITRTTDYVGNAKR